MKKKKKVITAVVFVRIEAQLTALVTSISYTFWKETRSKKASFPFPSSFFTEVPVTTSLSSGLKQQSVLQKNVPHTCLKSTSNALILMTTNRQIVINIEVEKSHIEK